MSWAAACERIGGKEIEWGKERKKEEQRRKEAGRGKGEKGRRKRPGRRSGLCPWLPGPCARCLWRAGLLQSWGPWKARWGSQHGQLVQVVVDSGKGARSQACSGHKP